MLSIFKSLVKNILSILPIKIDYLFNISASPIFIKLLNFKNLFEFDLYSFGKKNAKKTFYVIQRSPGAGLFSNLTFVFNHLMIAKKMGFVPFVDMQNFKTIYNENKKILRTNNAWEYYFKQLSKYSIKDIYSSKRVIITKNRFYKGFSYKVANKKFRVLTHELFKIKKEFVNYSNNYIKKNLTEKTLGIHYRGTSYKTSANHPFPCTKKQIIKYCEHLIKKYNYKKIFLCTEDKEIFDLLTKTFSDKVLYLKDSYRSLKDDSFKVYPRKNHRYKLGKEILIESLILSKCDGFLHLKTNVSEFVKFLDKKNKIKYHQINNGFNSSNEYIAMWLWYYKNLMPKILGGFN